MPLKVEGDPGYGSLVAPGPATANVPEGSETVPLLLVEDDAGQNTWKPLTREELMVSAGGPGWIKFRSRLVLFFWLGWLTVLAAAIVVLVQSPKPVATPLHWWQRELFYQLQPALFLDTESAGSGVITKVSETLPYLKDLGIGVMILEGLFRHDVTPLNLTEIDLQLGTSAQFHQFIAESQEAGVRVILDLCQLDLLTGPEFSNEIPVTKMLPDASAYIQHSLQHWLEQGVSGFKICDMDQIFSEKILTDWRRLVKKYSTEDNERILMVKQTSDFSPSFNMSRVAVNMSLVDLISRSLLPPSPHPLSAGEVVKLIDTKLRRLQGDWQSWTLDGKVPSELQKVIMVLIMTLPGTPIFTLGDETLNSSLYLPMYAWKHRDTPQKNLYEMRSSTALFKSLSRTRSREEALLYGSFTFLHFNTTSLGTDHLNSTVMHPLAFLRSWGCVCFLVLLNLGSEEQSLDTNWALTLPDEGVFVTSTGLNRFGAVPLQSIKLQPHEGVVIKLIGVNKFF